VMAVNADKRNKIIDTALILFNERGFDGTAVPMIAEKAEVGTGTIYRYFQNKEALVNELFQECVKRLIRIIQHNYPESSADVCEQFQHIFYGMVQFAKEDVHALYFIETQNNAHYLDGRSKEIFQELLSIMHEFFNRGKKQGVIRPLPTDALIAIVFSTMVGLCKLIRIGELEETPELSAGVEAACWDAVRKH
jgi:TetR/AcrR family transcriptional regulator, repressor of fatR-cypB operon